MEYVYYQSVDPSDQPYLLNLSTSLWIPLNPSESLWIPLNPSESLWIPLNPSCEHHYSNQITTMKCHVIYVMQPPSICTTTATTCDAKWCDVLCCLKVPVTSPDKCRVVYTVFLYLVIQVTGGWGRQGKSLIYQMNYLGGKWTDRSKVEQDTKQERRGEAGISFA